MMKKSKEIVCKVQSRNSNQWQKYMKTLKAFKNQILLK